MVGPYDQTSGAMNKGHMRAQGHKGTLNIVYNLSASCHLLPNRSGFDMNCRLSPARKVCIVPTPC